MKKPNNLNGKDIVALSSMSNGIVKESKKEKLNNSIKRLQNNFIVKADNYIFCSIKGESCNAKLRAVNLMNFFTDKNVRAIIAITGGDFLIETLDYLDFEKIKNNIKWVQGQSDITILLFILTTKYDIQTIYSFNANSLNDISFIEYNNNILILKGKRIIQNAFDYKVLEEGNKDDSWLFNRNINLTGRIIGGSLECIMDLVGTKYDNTLNFIEKYKKDKIIWYFDINYMTNETILRNLWHLNNMGWFKYTNCIIFGRTEEQSFTGITLKEAIERGINNEQINIVTNFDLGHTYPRVTIINGSIIKLVCNKDERMIEVLE